VARETEILGESGPSVTLSTTDPTRLDLSPNPGRRGGKLAINHLSYGTAYNLTILSIYLYNSTAFVELGRFFSFLISSQSAGFIERGISPSQGVSYTHNKTNTE
jgi:hypothetical protein